MRPRFRLFIRLCLAVLCVAVFVFPFAPIITSAPSALRAPSAPSAWAEDASLTLKQPTVPGQRLSTSSLWRQLEPQLHELPPTWQRRCQELHSIAVDTDTIDQQLPPLLSELKSKFLQAQQSVVYLLLDLAPTTMEASGNDALVVRLEAWQWYLADPVHYVAMVEQGLATYAGVLREVGEALGRPRTADTPAQAALLEVLPEVRSLHALLEARVAYLESTIVAWLRPARTLQEQVRVALESTLRVQPRLWLNYYTSPLRLSRLSFERVLLDFELMVETLTRGEIFARPVVLSALLTSFVLGSFVLLFRTVKKICPAPLARGGTGSTGSTGGTGGTGDSAGGGSLGGGSLGGGSLGGGSLGSGTSLWRMLAAELNAQSTARKVALAVGGVCVASIFVDALPFVHVHIPFVWLYMCLLLVAVAGWAKNDKKDPSLLLLALPVVAGFVLLEGNASPLWMLGGMSAVLAGCAAVMGVQRARRARSAFHTVWLGVLVLGLLLTFLGFSRITALLVGAVLFCRAGAVVLWTLYHIKGLHDQPLRLSLLMPLMAGWLYSLGLVLGIGYPGVNALWDYGQADALQFFGMQWQLRDVLLLLALGLGLLVFAALSRQMLYQASRQRKLLDSSAVPVIHAVVNSLLWVLFTLFALGLLGVDMRSLAFIGGALTVGLGLGLQGIITNFFSGLVIIFARVVRGGDIIDVGTVRGRVHSVNMRATVLETAEGGILLVPNGEMLNSRLTNWTRNNRHVRADLNLRLALPLDVEATMTLLEEVAMRHADILPNPAPTAFLLKSDEGVVDVALQVWLSDVDRKRAILSSLQTELCLALQGLGVNLAVPPLDVLMKNA